MLGAASRVVAGITMAANTATLAAAKGVATVAVAAAGAAPGALAAPDAASTNCLC